MARLPLDITVRAANGRSLSGSRLYVYKRGTEEAAVGYTNEAGSTQVTYPLTSDQEGRYPNAWFAPGEYDLHSPDDAINPTQPWTAALAPSEKGVANGIATLDAEGHQPTSQLSPSVVSDSRGSRKGDLLYYNGSTFTKVRSLVPVEMYGAVGDGETDDTEAIQKAIETELTANGGGLLFAKEYKITAALAVPAAAAWRIAGLSRYLSKIVQHTANTPIFEITHTDTHSWEICDLSFSWAEEEPASNTKAAVVYFKGNAESPTFYLWGIERVVCEKGALLVGCDTTTKFSVWGYRVRDIFLQSTMSRGAARIKPSTATGNPNGRWEHIYIRADKMEGPVFEFSAQTNCVMDNIEVNLAEKGCKILVDEAGGSYVIPCIRIEGGTYGESNNELFTITGSSVRIGLIHLVNLKFTAATNADIFRATPTSQLEIEMLDVAENVKVETGTVYVLGQAETPARIKAIRRAFPSGMLLTNLTSTGTATTLTVDQYNNGRLSADKGDADYTIALGDPNTIFYNTALTAKRTITLPATSASNVFNGLRYRVVRSAAATGESKLAVGSLKELAAGQWCEVMYQRSAWRLIANGSL